MFKRLTMPLLALLAIALFAAGCGGDDGDDTGAAANGSNGSSSEKVQFLKEAEQICLKEGNKALSEVGEYIQQNSSGNESVGQVRGEAIVTILLPALEKQVKELQQLESPAEDEAELEAFYAAMQRSIDDVRQNPPDSENLEKAGTELRNAFLPADKLGRPYGFETCAYGGVT